jgi:hypothetical protein
LRRRLSLVLALALGLLAGLAALTSAAAQQPEGRSGQPIIIRWSTETEVNTAGFNVYRGLSEDGPWEKINPRLIPGSPDPLRGGSYVFTDTNVIAGVTYWYELEEVELGGRATRLERTTATATAPGLDLLGALPCGGGMALWMLVGLAVVFAGRSRRQHGHP